MQESQVLSVLPAHKAQPDRWALKVLAWLVLPAPRVFQVPQGRKAQLDKAALKARRWSVLPARLAVPAPRVFRA